MTTAADSPIDSPIARRPITRLLVANRGEIASRIFRTAGDLGIKTVAVFSEADADLPYVREADLAVALPGNAPTDTYLRIDLLIDAAQRSGADAVHPGYGFLAENAAFAQAVIDAGLIWVGPPPSAMASMGSKVQAKALMREAGVPVLPDATLAGDIDPDALRAAADGVGYPLLVKASAGGGGRGMRVVETAEQVVEAVDSARREAISAFGDGTLFLERYLGRARHVEIQVMADTHGNVVSLFERECSIQRRHQKIVEEAPSPVVTPALRERMGAAAVAAARSVDYVGAGTVEFLLDGEDFWFLEMNTRLQVEHAVTEEVTGLDLVELQIRVAEGDHLPDRAVTPAIHGHAIEVRLYAEDPSAGYRPSAGVLHGFSLPWSVRIDATVDQGGTVSPFYDPMLAKLTAHAPTRAEAARVLADGLAASSILGVSTNRDQLVEILRHPAFLAGETHTGFLDEHDISGQPSNDGLSLALVAATLTAQARRRRDAPVLAAIPSGWRNNPSQPQRALWQVGGERREVTYRLDRLGRLAEVAVDGQAVDCEVVQYDLNDGVTSIVDAVVLTEGPLRRRFFARGHGGPISVQGPDGAWLLEHISPFVPPDQAGLVGSLVAPMPGVIVRVAVAPGAVVAAGDTLVAIEAMKMEHAISAPSAGTVESVLVEAGQQVDAGQPLLVLAAPAEDDQQ